MAETHNNFQKKYLRQLAIATDLYWEGDEKQALQTLKQADLDIEASLGKQDSEKFQKNLDGWLRKWRDKVLDLDWDSKLIKAHSLECFQELKPPDDSFQSSESEILFPEEILAEEELNIVFSLYSQDKILESIKLLTSLKERYQSDFADYPLVTEIENDYKDIRKVYESVQDKEGWIKDHSGKISVFYKQIPGTPTFSLLTEGFIDAPFFNFLSILYETDLYYTWVPFCKKSFTIAKLSKTRKIILQEYHIPLFATRHSCMYGYGANFLRTDGAVLIISKSCDAESYFKDIKLPEHLKTKRAIVNIMGSIIKPITPDKIHVTLITNFDPVIKFFPYKILNYLSKKVAKGIFKKLAILAKNFKGSEYEARTLLPENKEFYDYLKLSESEYFNLINNVN